MFRIILITSAFLILGNIVMSHFAFHGGLCRKTLVNGVWRSEGDCGKNHGNIFADLKEKVKSLEKASATITTTTKMEPTSTSPTATTNLTTKETTTQREVSTPWKCDLPIFHGCIWIYYEPTDTLSVREARRQCGLRNSTLLHLKSKAMYNSTAKLLRQSMIKYTSMTDAHTWINLTIDPQKVDGNDSDHPFRHWYKGEHNVQPDRNNPSKTKVTLYIRKDGAGDGGRYEGMVNINPNGKVDNVTSVQSAICFRADDYSAGQTRASTTTTRTTADKNPPTTAKKSTSKETITEHKAPTTTATTTNAKPTSTSSTTTTKSATKETITQRKVSTPWKCDLPILRGCIWIYYEPTYTLSVGEARRQCGLRNSTLLHLKSEAMYNSTTKLLRQSMIKYTNMSYMYTWINLTIDPQKVDGNDSENPFLHWYKGFHNSEPDRNNTNKTQVTLYIRKDGADNDGRYEGMVNVNPNGKVNNVISVQSAVCFRASSSEITEL